SPGNNVESELTTLVAFQVPVISESADVTVVVSLLPTVFEFLAFKNDTRLSVCSVLFNIFLVIYSNRYIPFLPSLKFSDKGFYVESATKDYFQMFTNYKLKFACLPWGMLTYKFISTFIDDMFVFVIRMPMLYRIGRFRDDIMFLVSYIFLTCISPIVNAVN
ncbi:unnamed protein product, partial [Strongylus vulgaris]